MTENKGLIKDLEGKLREGDKKIAKSQKRHLKTKLQQQTTPTRYRLKECPSQEMIILCELFNKFCLIQG